MEEPRKPRNSITKPAMGKLLCRLMEFVVAFHKRGYPREVCTLRGSDCLFAIETLPGMVFEGGFENSLSLNDLEQYVIGNYLSGIYPVKNVNPINPSPPFYPGRVLKI
jgi:hypothetical protein